MYLHTFFIDQQIDSGAIIKQEKITLTDQPYSYENEHTSGQSQTVINIDNNPVGANPPKVNNGSFQMNSIACTQS